MEYQPQYRTKKLNPNYSYECVDMDRHYKLQKQISYDNGRTWQQKEIPQLDGVNAPFVSTVAENNFVWVISEKGEVLKGRFKRLGWAKQEGIFKTQKQRK